jgi:DDE superfamily endonuclease
MHTVDAHTPADLGLHLILDNSSIHTTPLVHRWLLRHPRVTRHCTPTSVSWLNLVECWFALLTTRRLVRGAIRSTWALEQAIKQYIAATNAEPRPFVWTKTADEILESVGRYCQRIRDSHHQAQSLSRRRCTRAA